MGRSRDWGGCCAAVRVAFALLGLAFATAGQGQSAADGAIAGAAFDAAGVPVAGAVVEIRGVETGLAVQTISGAHGEFMVARLPAGEYSVTVDDGASSQALPELVAVELGGVTEVEARLGARTRSAATEDASSQANSQLPVDGGEWRSVALTAAGGAAANGDDGEESFRGEPVAQNSSRLDGMSADESFSGKRLGAGVVEDGEASTDVVDDPAAGAGSGARSVSDGGQRAGSAYAFSQAEVREFRVQGQAQAAEYGSALYGHGVGGEISAVSRSGGRTFHGMGFYTVRDSAWAAVNPFAVASSYANGVVTSALVKPADLRQQFGGSVGGPVAWNGSGRPKRNQDETKRLFFFYAFEQLHRNFPAISSPGYAAFYSLTPMQQALLANRGVKPAETNAALNYLDSLTGTVARTAEQTVNFGRLDWQRRGGSRVVLEYNRARWSNPGGARSGAVVDRAITSVGSSFGKVDEGLGRWVEMWRHGLSNELRVQDGRELQYETAQAPLAQEPNIGPGGMPPEVSIGPDGLVFGTPAGLGQRAYPDERRLEMADLLGWVHGRHLLQVGGDLSLLADRTDSLTNVDGTFSYDSGVTNGKAGGLVDWITDYTFNVNAYPNGGCPSITAAVHDFCFRSYSQSFGQQSLNFSTQEWAGFAQDDWRVADWLTVHAGVRYEYEFLPLPQQPNAALDEVFGSVGATSVFPEDRNNAGPRLGLDWAPFGAGGGVLRAGYGVYFGKLPGATIRSALLDTALPGSVERVRILPATETVCPQNTTVGFGYPCAYLAAPGAAVAATSSAMVFDRRFRMPMVQQATLTVERELGWGVLGSATYDLNLDRQLPNSVDINIAPSTDVKEFELQGGTGAAGARDGETFAVPVYTSRLTTSFGPVTDVVSNANASYNGATFVARRGFGSSRAGYMGAARGLDFRAAWTWSKAIDFGQSGGAVPRTNGQFDPFDVRYDKGLSALNFPHRLVVTAVWTPQAAGAHSSMSATAERAVWRVLDGWSLAGIFTEASGRGYSYEILGGTRLAGGRESINGSGGSTVLPTVGRNTERLPDSANLDLRLSRSFRLGEAMRLRGSVEAFNAANHVNISGVMQRAYLVGTPVPLSGTTGPEVTPLVFQNAAEVATEGLNVLPFGAYTEAGTNQTRERQVQLSLRLEF